MSKFTRTLDKIYGSHTLTAILASDVDEPKKEEQPEKPSEKPVDKSTILAPQLA